MRFVSITTLIWLLLVSQCWPSDAGYSLRIQKLLKEARAAEATAGNRSITFETTTDLEGLQGGTNYSDGRIVIKIPPASSPEYDDALKAHELTHVILNARGFAGVGLAADPKAGAAFVGTGISDTTRQHMLDHMGVMLSSCFPDELIDRETTKRGFKPGLLLQRDMEGTIKVYSSLPNNYEHAAEIEKHNQALHDFCLLRRLSKPLRLKCEKATELKEGPSIDMLRKRLLETFAGKRCEIDKPDACYRLTLELRGAAGLKGVILLPKPKTWEME
jgi:hypothetical protein